jgi:hypothetical protein
LVGEAFVSGLADPYLEDDSAKAVEALQSVEDDEAERFTSSATDAEAQEPIPHWQPKNWGDFRVERDSGVQCNYYQGSGHQINQYQGSGTYHYNSTALLHPKSLGTPPRPRKTRLASASSSASTDIPRCVLSRPYRLGTAQYRPIYFFSVSRLVNKVERMKFRADRYAENITT